MGETILLVILVLLITLLILYNSSFSGIFNKGEKYYQDVCLTLSQYEYFKKLSEPDKKKFADIIRKFNKRMFFHGGDGFIVTEEHKLIIAAGYAKLTIGNNFGKLYTFRSIVVFPKAYKDEDKKRIYSGKTSLEGYISLSWEDILKSETNLHDGINLALHEFAHAMVVEMMQDQVSFELEYFMVRHIYFTAKHEIEKFKKGEEMTLRKYAYSSPHEFFATAVELFFETPEKLIEYSWITYRNLCVLFRQNPLCNEIGKINWERVLNSPHSENHLNTSISTKSYGTYDFFPQTITVEMFPTKSLIEIRQNKKVIQAEEILHKEVLFAAKKYIPPSKYTSEVYKFILYLIRNNDIESLVFTTDNGNSVEKMIEIYRSIGLSN